MSAASDNFDAVDVQFVLEGQAVPRDYADALWLALRVSLPWLDSAESAGVHPLQGVSPGENVWYLSRRSRLTIRLPRARAASALALSGAVLELGDCAVRVGAAAQRELLVMPVLYSKFVAFGPASDAAIGEADFHAACRSELAKLDMTPRLICGKAQQARTAHGILSGFSLMLFDLTVEQNLRLQACGLGGERGRGCGIFVPHKSIAAVGTPE